MVNGKPALEWVIKRQAVTTHKDSGIVNDANLWATETMGDAAYPLKLFQRVITVSLETMKIVRALPRLDFALPSESALGGCLDPFIGVANSASPLSSLNIDDLYKQGLSSVVKDIKAI